MKIEITKYKNHTIYYEDGKFLAMKGKKIVIPKCSSESVVKAEIDKTLTKKERDKEAAKKQAKLKAKNKNILKAKFTVNGKEFKQFIKGIKELVNESTLKFTKTKITVTAMDPANVCLLNYEVPCKGNATIDKTLNVNTVYQIAKTSKPDLKIGFSILDEDTVHMTFTDSRGTFSVPIDNPEKKPVEIPKLKFLASASISKTNFNTCLDCADVVAGSIIFEAKRGKLRFFANDKESYKTSIKCEGKPATSKYSIEYLRKHNLQGRFLKIEFGNDYPLKLSDTKGNFMVLAPRVEND